MIGMQIGPYKILEKLGQGGMGVVYKGVDTGLDRPVAMKVLNPDLSSNPELVTRFQSEAKAQANLNHTNLATLYAFMVHQGTAIMVMEFVEGETFAQIIRRRGPIPEREAIPMFMQALLGIGYAHRAGIIHRDIKPSNLMLNNNGIVKVMDFGIAKVVGARGLTRTGMQLGTLAYMSPEQIQNRNVDIRSDIYELGITLYEMLTGHLPFEGDSEFQIMQDQVFKSPPPPRKLYPYIAEGIEAVVLKSVEKDPDSRFQTVEQFGAALQHPESLAQTYYPPVAHEDAATASLRGTVPQVYPPPSAPTPRAPAPSVPAGKPPVATVPSAPAAPRASYPLAAPPLAPTMPQPAAPAYGEPGIGPTRVSATVAQPQTPAPMATSTPAVVTPAPAASSKKFMIIGVCVLLVLVIGGVAAYQAMSPAPSRGPSSAAAPATAKLIPEQPDDAPPPSSPAPAAGQPAPASQPVTSSPKTGHGTPKPSATPTNVVTPAQTATTQPAQLDSVALMQRAQAAYAQGRIFEPTNDCALHWAIEARKAGNPGGKAMEDSIVSGYKSRVTQYYKQGNYGMAMALVQAMLKFYPGNAGLMADQQRIQAAANSSKQ